VTCRGGSAPLPRYNQWSPLKFLQQFSTMNEEEEEKEEEEEEKERREEEEEENNHP
jgi:hypothetical protein